MTPLTYEQVELALSSKYEADLRDFPEAFSKLIPRSAPPTQFVEVQAAVRQLTDCDCSAVLREVLSQWDFSLLNVAGFSFGYRGTFADRLESNNRPDAVNAWWEGAFEQRPETLLFIAQGDPYVLLIDVRTDRVLAYQAGDGAATAVPIASDLSSCLRLLSTVQTYKAEESARGLTVADLKDALGDDFDTHFWAEQIRHWSQFN